MTHLLHQICFQIADPIVSQRHIATLFAAQGMVHVILLPTLTETGGVGYVPAIPQANTIPELLFV